jgi:hypothetical protein
LVESVHEIAVQVNEDLRPAVEAAGHRLLSEIPNPQTSAGHYFDTYPERVQKSPGMEMTGYDLVHFFARNIPPVRQPQDGALRFPGRSDPR